ncbi:MAG TPA: twin-arginine translocase TatA/TatE family subunit [Actinomycetota bacterium]
MSFGPEWIVVIAVIVLLFGAKKLPELARSLGRSSSEFKKGMQEGTSELEQTPEPSKASEPSKAEASDKADTAERDAE